MRLDTEEKRQGKARGTYAVVMCISRLQNSNRTTYDCEVFAGAAVIGLGILN